MNDKELVFQIQNNKDEKALSELFNECIPAIHKIGKRLSDHSLKDDFIQESWIVFLGTVEKVDTTKVDENWKFVYFLWKPVEYLLFSMNRKSVKENSFVSNFDYETQYESFDDEVGSRAYLSSSDIESYDYEKYSIEYQNRSSEEYLSPRLEKFFEYLEELNPVYLTILKLKQEGILHKDIQSIVGLSKKQMSDKIAKMRKIASYIFETKFIHSDDEWVKRRLNIVHV